MSERGTEGMKHITVCVCTFERPELLKRLLDELATQRTQRLFSYSVVVVDNDHRESGRAVVEDFISLSLLPTKYCVEPTRNIALARNRALSQAEGDFIAFIDDDEYPGINWLRGLFELAEKTGADAVLGPVRPYFASLPPQWATRGNFFGRPTHPSGHSLHWSEARTGNVLLRSSVALNHSGPFRREFGTGGEDVDFFRRIANKGSELLWCQEAPVYEFVPDSRCTRAYLLRRALLRGSNSLRHRPDRTRNIAKSLIAIPIYGFALPFILVSGQHRFMKVLIKFCDHLGRLLALGHLNPIQQRDP